MSKIMAHCGKRIRLYRRNRNITITQLAAKINKSKSTVSKYEQGIITIDIDTLLDIANALNITIYQLLDYENVHDQLEARRRIQMLPLDNNQLFLYYYDGRNKRLTRGVIVIRQSASDDITSSNATLYLDCRDLKQYQDCTFLADGRVERYSSLIRYILTNQSNPIEQIIINVLDPLSNAGDFVGHLTALSNNPFTPISLKCILSQHPLAEDSNLKTRLILNKDDFRNMRKMNMFTPYLFY